MDKITVLLADDHHLVRRGFRRMLEDDPDLSVVGEASDGDEAVRLALSLSPRVVVMDCAMPGTSGLVATRRIHETRPDIAILMLSMHAEQTLVSQALDSGARGYILKNAVDLDLGSAVKRVAAGETVLDPTVTPASALKGERNHGLSPRELEVLQLICQGHSNRAIAAQAQPQRQHRERASGQHHGPPARAQDGRTGRVRAPPRVGGTAVNRREFVRTLSAGALTTMAMPAWEADGRQNDPGMRLVDVTSASGVQFRHRNGAYGGKLLPETMGAGCAFLDFDADGWQDILFVNGMDWPGHKIERSTLRLYRNNRNGTFSDVTKSAGLDVELYGMGVAVGDWNNDGFPDLLITCVGQNRLFRNTGKGTFVDVTKASGLGGRTAFSTSALWFDFDRDGLLDLFVCNYVKWSAEHDVFCTADGKQKSYCTPEAYRGDTCWLFRNRGNGTFEDVTATSGIFDSSSKSLGVAMLGDDQVGWPDLMVANDTQPNKLYRNQRNGTFKEVGVQAGVALSADGRARAGMGIDSGDFDNSGRMGVAVTNFDNEMAGLYRPLGPGLFEDVAVRAGVGAASRNRLGFGCLFADLDLDGALDLVLGERTHRRGRAEL